MASTPTLARRAHTRALTAALALALIALPAQARADAGDESAPQSAAQGSTAAQSAPQAAPSASPSPEATDAPEPAAPAASDEDRVAQASSESDEPPTMGAPDETGRGTWIRDSVGWWWRRADGTYPHSQWVGIGGARYYFYDSGYMATGWLRDGADWFFLAPSGALVGGWLKDGGQWYYLDPASGVMRTGMTGVDGTWYYLDSSGAMRTGWAHLDDGWHYFASSGTQTGGWLRDGGQWYYLDPASGVMRTGMTGVDGTWYYLDSSGAMRTGWAHLDDGWHYFASSGTQMGGWLKDGGQWYYLDPDTGIMRTEPLELNGRRYEFDASGAWRGYEAPAGYLQPTDHITGLGNATNTLTWGMNGTKVRIAQVRLGLWHSNKLASVDAPFVAAVKNFHRLPVDRRPVPGHAPAPDGHAQRARRGHDRLRVEPDGLVLHVGRGRPLRPGIRLFRPGPPIPLRRRPRSSAHRRHQARMALLPYVAGTLRIPALPARAPRPAPAR